MLPFQGRASLRVEAQGNKLEIFPLPDSRVMCVDLRKGKEEEQRFKERVQRWRWRKQKPVVGGGDAQRTLGQGWEEAHDSKPSGYLRQIPLFRQLLPFPVSAAQRSCCFPVSPGSALHANGDSE